MSDLEGFFVESPADRYGIGNMAEHLQPEPDVGLTIHMFFMVMRRYQPEQLMYRGEYTIPSVKRTD